MNKFIFGGIGTILIVSIFISCQKNSSDGINNSLKNLIDVGYSVQELSIRTEYTEDELINAYLYDNDVLSDSIKNAKIQLIQELNKKDKIIPINKLNVTAYDGIWQIYTKAQNLPRVSLYTGIGVSKVACALMKRKPLVEYDSLRALVGYVNMLYDLEDMPPSIDKYYTKTTTIRDLSVPVTFRPKYTDKIKLKIEYYIYQNEQLELRANENLKKAIDGKVDGKIRSALEQFVSDDVSSVINTTRSFFKDSLEQIQFYKEKLSERLGFEKLNEEIRNEIINYCISISCSRAILINEVLNYKEFIKTLDVRKKVILENYVNNLEEVTAIMEKERGNLGIDTGVIASSIALGVATAGVMNPATSMFSMQAAKIFLIETFEYAGLDAIVKDIFGYDENERSIESMIANMQNKLQTDINLKMSEFLEGQGNYYEDLNENTFEYYQQVRNFFQIK